MTIEELLEMDGTVLESLSLEELKLKIGPLIIQEQALQKDLKALADTQPKKKKEKKEKKSTLQEMLELQKQIEAQLKTN